MARVDLEQFIEEVFSVIDLPDQLAQALKERMLSVDSNRRDDMQKLLEEAPDDA